MSDQDRTVRILLRFLAWFCPDAVHEGVEGDIVEQFESDSREFGKKTARRRLVLNVLKFFRPGIFLRNKFLVNTTPGIMFKNYFTTYLRNLSRNKVPSMVNLAGLIVGMTSVFLLTIFVQYEFSFDRYPEKASSIYRIVFGTNDRTGSVNTSQIMGTTLKERYPGVTPVRFNNAGNARVNFKVGEQQFMETGFYFTDPEALEVFSFKLAEGDSRSALVEPFTMVIARKAASKFFGDESPLNKSIAIDWSGVYYDVKITGVMDEVPSNSHITFDYLISIATAERIFQPKSFFTDWTANFCVTYVAIANDKIRDDVARGLNDLYKSNVPAEVTTSNVLRLQPLSSIHLYSALSGELQKNGDVKYIYIALAIAIAVLIVSLINYTNILSSLFTLRLKEIGVRKCLGAKRRSIMSQFLGESMMNVILAFIGSILLLLIVSPWLSNSFGINLTLQKVIAVRYIWLGPAAVVVAGLVVGVYPSLLVANVAAASVLYGKVRQVLTNSFARNFLVGVQVFIGALILFSALVIRKQLQFMEDKELGFTRDQILSIPQGRAIREKAEFVKHEMAQTGVVVSSTLSSHLPTRSLSLKVPAIVEGGNPDGTQNPYTIALISVDYDFFRTFGLTIVNGRSFSPDFPSDSTSGFVINEAAAKALHWSDPIGKEMQMTYNVGNGTVETRKGKVIGVINDFHFESLHKTIEPLVMMYKPFWFYFATFRITPGDPVSTVSTLQKKWESTVPNTPFEYAFMTDRLEQLYFSERSLARGADIFSAIAIGISGLGLFGLISFLVQTRMKEIAVRKVMGADVFQIAFRLYVPVMTIVIVGSAIALPLGWFLTSQWLESFAYRTTPGPWVMILTLVIISSIACLVMFREIFRAAHYNPVDILKAD